MPRKPIDNSQREISAPAGAPTPPIFDPVDLGTAEGSRKMLEFVANSVLDGSMTPARGTVLAKLASVGLKLAEVRLATRLAALEARMGAPKRKR